MAGIAGLRRARVAIHVAVYHRAQYLPLALRSENLRKTLPLGDSPEPGIRETVTADVTVDQLLRQLPEAQREVITLFYLQDQSIGEVAQQLDLPEGTVKSHLHRARRTLGEIMKE